MVRARSQTSRVNDPVGLRNGVLDAAATLFQGRGYNATAVHDIVEAARISSGALHHHFPTKRALGLAVIRERVAPAVEQAWIQPLLDTPSAADGLRAVFSAIRDELEERRRVQGCPLNNLGLELSLVDPLFRQEIQAIFTRWCDAVAARLQVDVDAGVLKNIDPPSFALFVVASYSGAMSIAKAEQATRALDICANEVIRNLT